MKTVVQELREYLEAPKSVQNIYEVLDNLAEIEKTVINKAFADGIVWGLKAVHEEKVSDENYYDSRYEK